MMLSNTLQKNSGDAAVCQIPYSNGVAKSWVNEVHDVSLVVWEHLLVQLPAIERVNE